MVTRKRRGSGEGSIRQRTDGLWEATVSLGDGRRKSWYGKTRAAAQRKLNEALHAKERGTLISAKDQPLGKFLATWLEDVAKPRVRASTFGGYESCVRLYLKPSIGKIALSKLTPQDVNRCLRETGAKVSPRTVQLTHAVLRSALRTAEKQDLVARNVAKLADVPSVKRDPVKPLSIEQVRKLLATARGHRHEIAFVLAVNLGLRAGEVLGLRWEDVDLGAARLHVRNGLMRVNGKLELVPPKTKQSRRSLPLAPHVVASFREHERRQKEERLRAGPAWKETGLVVTTGVGTPFDKRWLLDELHEVLAKAELPKQRFHDLRHFAASSMLASGVGNVKQIQETLGHSTILLTLNTYAHLMGEDATRAMVEKAGAALLGEK